MTTQDEQFDSSHSNVDTKQHEGRKRLNETIIFMDSNRKILDKNLLWKNSTMVECPTTATLHEKIEKTSFADFDIVVIHVGVNDIDTKDGQTVADDLYKEVETIRTKAPHVKVVLSEVTPRQNSRDNEVIECNKQLETFSSSDTNITLATHSNLRYPEMFRSKTDDKHFHQNKSGILASNIKRALRQALGIQNERNPRNNNYTKRSAPHKGGSNTQDFKNMLRNILKNL